MAQAFRITLRRSGAPALRVVVGRSVAKRAVVRNTLRRQVREWFRQHRIAPSNVAITVYVFPSVLQHTRRERYRLLAHHAAAIGRGSGRAGPHRRL